MNFRLPVCQAKVRFCQINFNEKSTRLLEIFTICGWLELGAKSGRMSFLFSEALAFGKLATHFHFFQVAQWTCNIAGE